MGSSQCLSGAGWCRNSQCLPGTGLWGDRSGCQVLVGVGTLSACQMLVYGELTVLVRY